MYLVHHWKFKVNFVSLAKQWVFLMCQGTSNDFLPYPIKQSVYITRSLYTVRLIFFLHQLCDPPSSFLFLYLEILSIHNSSWYTLNTSSKQKSLTIFYTRASKLEEFWWVLVYLSLTNNGLLPFRLCLFFNNLLFLYGNQKLGLFSLPALHMIVTWKKKRDFNNTLFDTFYMLVFIACNSYYQTWVL